MSPLRVPRALVALGLATVVAAPLALLAAAGLFFGLYAGYLLSAALLGELLLKVAQRPASPFATFALGLLTLGLVDLVPLLGPIATVAATLAGFGGLLLLARVPREAR